MALRFSRNDAVFRRIPVNYTLLPHVVSMTPPLAPLSAGWIVSSACGILAGEAVVGMPAIRRSAWGFLGTCVESVSALPMLQRCHIMHLTVPARCICLTFGTDASGRCVVSRLLRKRALSKVSSHASLLLAVNRTTLAGSPRQSAEDIQQVRRCHRGLSMAGGAQWAPSVDR